MPNPLTQDPGQSFIDSPWLQLGVPLAATIASAIAPRHMGNASRAAIGGLDAINQNRSNQMRMQHYFNEDKQKQTELDDTNKFIDSLGHNASPPNAPAGGSAPEAERASATQSMNEGQVPGVTASSQDWSDDDIKLAHFYARTDKQALAKLIEEKRAPKEAKLRINNVKNEYGDEVENSYDPRTGTTSERLLANAPPPKPRQINSPFEGLMDEDPNVQARTRRAVQEQESLKAPEMEHGYDLNGNPVYTQKPRGPRLSQESAPSAPTSVSGQTTSPRGQSNDITTGHYSAGGDVQPQPQRAPYMPPRGPFKTPEEGQKVNAASHWRYNHPGATPEQGQQADVLRAKGVNTDDLDELAQRLAKADPSALIDVGKAIGRGSDVRSYVYGQAYALNPKFDMAGNDRKIAMVAEFADPKTPPGNAMRAAGTALRHMSNAVDQIQQLGNSGSPVLNMHLNDFLQRYAGSRAVAEVQTALSVVPYEYMTFIKRGQALDKQDVEKANSLVNVGMTVEQAMGTFQQMGHIMVDQLGEYNHTFKRTVGTDIPDLVSGPAMAATKKLGIDTSGITGNAPAPGSQQQQGQRKPIDSFFR